MGQLRYLAYGSNLHPRRLRERVPSATPLGSIELNGWHLAFEKRGRDGSAKCNLHRGRQTGSRPNPPSIAYGVIFEIQASERAALDIAEDLGRGYLEHRLHTADFGQVFLYLAAPDFIDPSLAPFDWYHDLVIAGARHHDLPQDYIAQIERIDALADPDRERHATALRILWTV